jgi:O-antigen/teichoic acid export membrane protein
MPAPTSMPVRNTVRRATLESVVSGVGGQFVTVISGVVVARMLGVENRGQFALIVLLPLVLSQVGCLGLPVAMTFFLAQGGSPRRLISATRRQLIIQCCAATAVHLVIAVILFAGRPRAVQIAAAMSLLVTPVALAQVWGLAVIQGERRFRSFNILRLVGGAVYSLGLIGVYVASRGTIDEAAAVWVASSVASSGVIGFVALRSSGSHQVGKDPPAVREMYRFGLSALLGSVFPVETFQLDQFYVGLVLSPAALGLYVVGAAFTNLTRFFLPQSIGAVAYPQVAAAPSFAQARRSIWRFFVLTLILCGAVVVVLELAGRIWRAVRRGDTSCPSPTARLPVSRWPAHTG